MLNPTPIPCCLPHLLILFLPLPPPLPFYPSQLCSTSFLLRSCLSHLYFNILFWYPHNFPPPLILPTQSPPTPDFTAYHSELAPLTSPVTSFPMYPFPATSQYQPLSCLSLASFSPINLLALLFQPFSQYSTTDLCSIIRVLPMVWKCCASLFAWMKFLDSPG